MPAQKIDQVPATLHVQIVRGDYWSIQVTFEGIDLTNRTVEAKIHPKHPPPAAEPAEIELDVVKTDAVNGVCTISLSTEKSEALEAGYHSWCVKLFVTPVTAEEETFDRSFIAGRFIVEDCA